MTTAALTLTGLSKHFGRIHAVRDLNLEIPTGQMVGFLGPNGAGKSTTLYMIPRLVRPSSGQIRIFGIDVWKDFRRAIGPVGMMIEVPAFYENLSARKNLQLMARLHPDVTSRHISDIFERINLAERQHDKVRTYSMGMKQRLGIGRALLSGPKLLILDEPTNGLDPEGTAEILSFLRQQVQEHDLTVYISSHLLHEVEEHCDSVFVIHQGHLVASGQVRDILKPHEDRIKVGFFEPPEKLATLTNDHRVQQVIPIGPLDVEVQLKEPDFTWLNSFLMSHGFKVRSIAPKSKTLKEFFLSITGHPNHAS